jgi:Flp pilus assembly protein TadB
VFRKQKSTDEAAEAESTQEETPSALDEAQAAKGRPTPTRRESELARKQRLSGVSGDPKKAKREARQRDFEASTERQHGGPVKQFARDYVDSRFRIAEFFIIFAVLLFVVASVPSVALLSVVLWLVMLVAIVIDSVLLVRGVKKEARKRFPNADLGRLGWYSLMRSMQFRKWRLPKPRLKRGEKF